MKITLVGSAKFEKEFKYWNEMLTLADNIVYSLAVYPSDKGKKEWYTEEQKTMLDKTYKDKIDNSDAILVINVGGYIGKGARNEIDYAILHNKLVLFIENCT